MKANQNRFDLKHAVAVADVHDIPIKTAEYVLRDLKDNRVRSGGYYGLHDKKFKEILESQK
jgi:hypothetical protein